MKKRMGLFLVAVALATTALVLKPATAAADLCFPHIACLIGPRCCTDAMCAGFCANLNGGVPHCSDPEGGCCSCELPEEGV